MTFFRKPSTRYSTSHRPKATLHPSRVSYTSHHTKRACKSKPYLSEEALRLLNKKAEQLLIHIFQYSENRGCTFSHKVIEVLKGNQHLQHAVLWILNKADKFEHKQEEIRAWDKWMKMQPKMEEIASLHENSIWRSRYPAKQFAINSQIALGLYSKLCMLNAALQARRHESVDDHTITSTFLTGHITWSWNKLIIRAIKYPTTVDTMKYIATREIVPSLSDQDRKIALENIETKGACVAWQGMLTLNHHKISSTLSQKIVQLDYLVDSSVAQKGLLEEMSKKEYLIYFNELNNFIKDVMRALVGVQPYESIAYIQHRIHQLVASPVQKNADRLLNELNTNLYKPGY